MSLPILGASRGTPLYAFDVAIERGALRHDFLRSYLDALYADAATVGIRADVLVAQADIETDRFRSTYWTRDGNPAGLAAFDDGSSWGLTFTPEKAARAHVVHMARYTGIDVPDGWQEADARWDAAAQYAGSVTTTSDLGNGRWATDPLYGAKIEARHEAYAFPLSEAPMTTMKAVNFVGAKRTAYLPSWIPVSIRIINHERFRSYSIYTHQTKSTYHDTGNERTEAEGEYIWAAGGRQGGSVGGYTFIFDDKVLIQTGPCNERSWHAGTPRGNESFGAEHAFGGRVVWTTSLEVGMALHGALIEMQDLNPDDAAVLHQYWTGKYCSAQILNRGIWPQVKAGIKRYYTLARAARNGQSVSVPTPGTGSATYAKPQLPTYPDGTPWDGKQDLVVGGTKFEAQRVTAKTTMNLRRRQWGSTESLDTGPAIPAGTEVELLGWVAGELVDGISEWWVGTSGSRLWAGGFDATPKEDPDFGKMPERMQGVYSVNGRIYYPLINDETGGLGRVIRVQRAGNLRRWAEAGSENVGTVEVGEDRVFKYWTRGEAVPLYEGGPDEVIWYAEDLHTGARMWAGLSDDRPD